jgi:hypothetical protein
LTLCKMFPQIFKKIERIYKIRVGNEIDEFLKYSFGKNYDEFRKYMMESNAIISGSFILQCVLNEKWFKFENTLSDIDIFVKTNPISTDSKIWKPSEDVNFYNYEYKFELHYTSLHKFLYKNQKIHRKELKRLQEKFFKKYNRFNENITKQFYDNYVTHSQYRDELGKNVILRINEYKIKKYMFEVIEINSDKYYTFDDFINETVDFEICKNYFYYTDTGFEIVIHNLSSIINKVTKTSKYDSERIKKYRTRGFSII